MTSTMHSFSQVSDERYLAVLADITNLLLRGAPPDEVCETTFTKLRSVLQLDAYFHFRVTTDGTRLWLASCRGCPPERLPEIRHLDFGQAVCGTVAAQRQSMYIPRIPERLSDLTCFVRSIGITCYACQPLVVNGRLLGTFSFGTRSRAEYTEQELQLIQLVCDQVALATSREVTRAEQARLERLAVAGQMAAKIAHEINNPLAAVTNLLYLLGKFPLSEEGKNYLILAQQELNRVADISKRTLGFYRQSGQSVPVNLRHTTDGVLAAAMFAAAKKRLNFAVEVPRDYNVQAIDCELAQILTNLVANAIHYSPEEETVRIAAFRLNGQVEVYVSDHGPGVSAEHSSKLFQPFFTTNNDSGNGLGLWISKELAHRMDGDLLLVPSTQGATFKLLLRSAA